MASPKHFKGRTRGRGKSACSDGHPTEGLLPRRRSSYCLVGAAPGNCGKPLAKEKPRASGVQKPPRPRPLIRLSLRAASMAYQRGWGKPKRGRCSYVSPVLGNPRWCDRDASPYVLTVAATLNFKLRKAIRKRESLGTWRREGLEGVRARGPVCRVRPTTM